MTTASFCSVGNNNAARTFKIRTNIGIEGLRSFRMDLTSSTSVGSQTSQLVSCLLFHFNCLF